jgi:glucosamine-6-phosphate deaminase
MEISISTNPEELGTAAGMAAASLIRQAIIENGNASIILATGASQFETLRQLVSEPGIDWKKVAVFHLDEYLGISSSHPASFQKYLQDRFLSKVGGVKAAVLIDGERDPEEECERVGALITQHTIDVAFTGIGENGHLAFNDPPADFDTEKPYIIVDLDGRCRQQQMNEGWFNSLEVVPKRAISMSIKQIMKSKRIICSVPDSRKANAVKQALEQPVSNLYPASILQCHSGCTLYLDKASAAALYGQ